MGKKFNQFLRNAARLGINVGDIIIEVAGAPIGDVRDLEYAIDRTGKKSALLRIARDGKPFFIGVRLPA